MNNVELARTLSWRENALLEEREKNNKLKNGMRNLFCNKKCVTLQQHITFITMERDVNIMLATYGKYFPETSLPQVREIFEHIDDSQAAALSCTQFKDPITSIILSILLGQFGADRFYLEQIGIGIAKLLTCGGLGVWTLIDLFLIMDATRQQNLQKLMSII